jgi:hypothetical protein
MTTREAHVVYYAESFCGLSETYVYRTEQMSFLYRANNDCDARLQLSRCLSRRCARHFGRTAADEYQQMRKAAWAKAHGLHSKRNVEDPLLACVCEVVPGDRMPAR